MPPVVVALKLIGSPPAGAEPLSGARLLIVRAVHSEVERVVAFEINEILPAVSAVFSAKAYGVLQLRLLIVIPVVGGVGSPIAWVALAQSASLNVLPTRYRTSKLAFPEPLSVGLLQLSVADVVVELVAARLATAAGAASSILTNTLLVVSTLPTLSVDR
jgi:hypothetical protein